MLSFFFYLVFSLAATVASPAICSPVSLGPRGFVGKVYAYQLNSMEGWDKGFFDCKYSLCPRIGGLSGVTELSFHLDQPDGRTIYNKVYNYRTSTTNYALDLKGFYRAPISGTYTFRVSGENGAQVQIGPGEICCDDTLADGTGDFTFDNLVRNGHQTVMDVKEASVSLTRGVYYPVKIVMFNGAGNTGFTLEVTDPLGNIITDFGSQVLQATFDKCE